VNRVFPVANTAIPAVLGVAGRLREPRKNPPKLAIRGFILQVSAVFRNMEFYIASFRRFL